MNHSIEQYNLQLADVLAVIKRENPLIKHYAVYIKMKGKFYIIANMVEGVQRIEQEQFDTFLDEYEVIKIIPFEGTERQREIAVAKAVNSLGEKKYHIFYNNCEHFANWVQRGAFYSLQVIQYWLRAFLAVLVIFFAGKIFKSKRIQRFSKFLLLFLAVLAVPILILALLRSDSDS
jgi:hypothetical protein